MRNPSSHNQSVSREPVNRGASSRAKLADLRVQIVIAFIEDNYQRKLTLGEMADAVNLSVWRLAHVFKNHVGTSPEHYLMLVRLNRAKGHLETSFRTVKEIASLVGMHDVSHFTRAFKTAYGITPSQYRESHLTPNLPNLGAPDVARSANT